MEKEKKDNIIQQLGPFLMQQEKNLMMTKNLLSPKEHKEFLKEIESSRPIIKSDIQEKISELEFILKFNFFLILSLSLLSPLVPPPKN
ncbi:hypothetical protein ES706_04091 [subsurface metagenome]